MKSPKLLATLAITLLCLAAISPAQEQKVRDDTIIIATHNGEKITTTITGLNAKREENGKTPLSKEEIAEYQKASQRYSSETPKQRKAREQQEDKEEKELSSFEDYIEGIMDFEALDDIATKLNKQKKKSKISSSELIATKLALLDNQWKAALNMASIEELEKQAERINAKLSKSSGEEASKLQDQYNAIITQRNNLRTKN